MKKIIVNSDACIGCGACVAIDPDHFAFNDEGLSHATNSENLESEVLMSAIDSCPTSAISIKDVEQETTNNTCECTECDCETCEDDDCDCENCDCCE